MSSQIDGVGGAAVSAIGLGHPEVVKARVALCMMVHSI